MGFGEWISDNETLLNGVAAVVVIIGFLGAIGQKFFSQTVYGRNSQNKLGKITLSKLSSPSPFPIRFANSEGINIAFNEQGQNGPTILVTPGIISNLHISSNLPPIKSTMQSLAKFARVVNFDKRGQGLSDPISKVASIDERIKDISSVADNSNSEKFFLMGISEGGPMTIQFAVENPSRVLGLILFGTTAKFSRGDDYPIGISDNALNSLASMWGTGAARDIFFPSLSRAVIDDETYRGFEKLLADKRSMGQIVEYMKMLDVRPLLERVSCPTLVIHFTGDLAVPIRMGRYLADTIPAAQFLEIAGVDHCDLGNAPTAIKAIKNLISAPPLTH